MHNLIKEYAWWIILAYIVIDGVSTGWRSIVGTKVRLNEEKVNEGYPRVGARQLSWHITHMREDVSLIAVQLRALQAKLSLIALLLFATYAGI
jgi:hypothetical protein